ncbi:MAG: hypothetical protein GX295_00640 [Syntrophomonadaceae bacterium]|nr:hypothetical protein [Syntrophomonadaceae bacterium]
MRLKSGGYSVKSKVIISGSVIEVYEYENSVYKGYKSNGGRDKVADDESKEKNRKDTLRRARQNLRRTVNANVWAYGERCLPKFLTLTFGDNVTDLDVAHYEFLKFIKRLNYLVFGTKVANLRYTAVPEFQKRGAVHYHVVLYNLPFVESKVIEEVWGNGFIKINKIDDVDNVGAYVCKYMVKELDDRLRGRKCYFNSRGLFKPIVIEDEKKVENIKNSLPGEKRTVFTVYENDYTGITIYKQYNLNKSN